MATNTKRRGKKKSNKKIIIFIIELIVLLALVLGLYIFMTLDKVDSSGEEFTTEEVNIDLSSETKEVLSGYTNIALFGLDNRSTGNYDGGNSDSIMIVSINNDTKEVKIVSVYRDTYMNVKDDTYNKINSAYSYGGAKTAVAALNKNLNLDITNYVSVDFSALVDAVDLLGGIELELTAEEIEIMNDNYIDEINQVTGKNSQMLDEVSGTYTVDGVQALAYCRIRYTAGDDFKRTERQRTVLTKMIEKAKGSSLTTISEFINTMFDEISTNYTAADMISLAKNVMDYSIEETQGWPFALTTGTFGSKGSLVVPCDLETNVQDLHKYLFGNTNDISSTVSKISEEIVNYTGCTVDSATRIQNPVTGSDNSESSTDSTLDTAE
ncbi:MAG: LCP family protein [Lachnospiraceae bacterium]